MTRKPPAWPADAVTRTKLADLIPYARNARTHSDAQIAQLVASIREWGWTMPVLVDEDGQIIAGHGRVLAAEAIGLGDVPTMTARGWSEAKRRAYTIADNKLALNAGWDDAILGAEFVDLKLADFDLSLTGFDVGELAELFADRTAGLTDPDDVPEAPADPVTVPGDVWLLGGHRHRLRCGSSSTLEGVDFFRGSDLVLTDPPYCSGGFQEGGRGAGSVGRRSKTKAGKPKAIINDKLSTRGYHALMRAAVFGTDAPFFYVFTDWRMWTTLFDLAEAGGAGVRSMIIWNKKSPGMGRGWRAQHEIIMWACRAKPNHDRNMPALGNVIDLVREPDRLHTTQKPVELLERLLKITPWVETVADPFIGSGSTMIACEKRGISCKGADLDPAYVDVSVRRWQDFTGRDATLEATGETFNQRHKASEAA